MSDENPLRKKTGIRYHKDIKIEQQYRFYKHILENDFDLFVLIKNYDKDELTITKEMIWKCTIQIVDAVIPLITEKTIPPIFLEIDEKPFYNIVKRFFIQL